MSHKVGRLLVPHALVALFIGSVWLITQGVIYAAAFAVQALLYGLAAYGGMIEARASARSSHARAPGLAFTFVLMNYATVAGLIAMRRGREVWR